MLATDKEILTDQDNIRNLTYKNDYALQFNKILKRKNMQKFIVKLIKL